ADTNPEIVIVTNVVDATHVQVTRGAEGSTVKVHVLGDQFTCILTAGNLAAGYVGVVPATVYAAASVYGLINDNGVSDQTTALQAAINAVPLGGTLILPAWRIKFSTVTLPVGMTVQGAGWQNVANNAY